MTKREPFLALCGLASRDHWCWNIYCTTCGHYYFRYGFKELITGKHPDSQEWVVCQANHNELYKLGDVLNLRLDYWMPDEQRELSKILCHTDLDEIHKTCKFPDWLGYLGLALYCTERVEREDRVITPVLVPQLNRLVNKDRSACNDPSITSQKSEGVLCWQSLQYFESAIRKTLRPNC